MWYNQSLLRDYVWYTYLNMVKANKHFLFPLHLQEDCDFFFLVKHWAFSSICIAPKNCFLKLLQVTYVTSCFRPSDDLFPLVITIFTDSSGFAFHSFSYCAVVEYFFGGGSGERVDLQCSLFSHTLGWKVFYPELPPFLNAAYHCS